MLLIKKEKCGVKKMSALVADFERLGFWKTETAEENITVFTMDFPSLKAYIIITNDDGSTPTDPEAPIVAACYSNDDCFQWGKELENFAALEKIFASYPPCSPELMAALGDYSLPSK